MSDFDTIALSDWTGGQWYSLGDLKIVSEFHFDARQLKAGDCFIALSGGARDGHDFCEQAVAAGASALMVERRQSIDIPQLVVTNTLGAMAMIARGRRNQFAGPVVGVTGSCGKTSTKEMLRTVLGHTSTLATAGNWNNLIGVPMTLFGLDPKRQSHAVIEAGINQPGEMAALGAMIQSDLTIVTMIGPAHLELLGSLEGIAEEKSQLALTAQATSPIVVPDSVFEYAAFRTLADRAHVLKPKGTEFALSVRAVTEYEIEPEGDGSLLTLIDSSGAVPFRIDSSSAGICTNAGLVILTARILGLSDVSIQERIQTWFPEGNRGRVLTDSKQIFYIDCYNANPASMRDALDAFTTKMPEPHARCYVLGAMNELGESAPELHRETAQSLRLRPQDQLCLVGPESLRNAYADGALCAGVNATQIHSVEKSTDLQSLIADFEGAIFLKGSRSYGLECLLPTAP